MKSVSALAGAALVCTAVASMASVQTGDPAPHVAAARAAAGADFLPLFDRLCVPPAPAAPPPAVRRRRHGPTGRRPDRAGTPTR